MEFVTTIQLQPIHDTTLLTGGCTFCAHADSVTKEFFVPVANQTTIRRIAAVILLLAHIVAIAWYLLERIIGTIRLRAISRRAMNQQDIRVVLDPSLREDEEK